MDHQGRQERLQEALGQHRLDALLITHPPNIRYLCGFTGSAGALLASQGECIFFTDGRYIVQARAEVEGARVVIARKTPWVAAAQWLARYGKTRSARRSRKRSPVIGIEGEYLSVAARARLAAMLPHGFRLKPAPAWVEQARMVKDAEEMERIRRAVWLGASLFDRLLGKLRPGVKETEVAAELEYAARRAGAQDMSFPTIIAAGERSALPHGRASEVAIPAAGFVVCDFGVILAGYCSDMTRTVHMGPPTGEAQGVYQAVREAQQAALEAVRPGRTTGEVDRAARKVLQKAGLGRYFSHSTGHGVGLEIHEAPRLAAGQQEVLRAGMVITLEPGAYIPGKWGVRIEDMVVVTETGCEVLTPTSKELIAL